MKLTLPAEPGLVGRELELTELSKLYDLAVSGKGSTVFISGEAGVGKTRLINEFLDQKQKEEVRILSGWCLSQVSIPYFPFVEAFSSYTTTNDKKIKQSVVRFPLSRE